MRILVAAHAPPWPLTSGARIRLANIIGGLGQLGEIDLFILATDTVQAGSQPTALPVERWLSVAKPRGAFTIGRRLRWLTDAKLPSDFIGRDYGQARRAFTAWRGVYDLVWCSRVETYLALAPLLGPPIIVDIDDLENRKIATRLRAVDRIRAQDALQPVRLLRHIIAQIQGQRNIQLWSQLYRQVAASVEAVVVCSDIDALRLGARNASIIPNGYEFPTVPVGRSVVGQPPTIVLTGYFKYPPNVDGAVYFVDEILPLIRAHLPSVQVRVSGDADERVLRLRGRPGITVTGFIQDMRSELALGDLIAVPLRYGSGTRIKILEAFAHRIPVVATPAAIEGIEAADGREILLGRTPRQFADQCVRLLTDEQRRHEITDAAHSLYVQRYRSEIIQNAVGSLAMQVAQRSMKSPSSAQQLTSELISVHSRSAKR